MTFENAAHRWKHEPDDGEYEAQFDRFETTEAYRDTAVLLLVGEEQRFLGQVVVDSDELPKVRRDSAPGAAMFDATVRDGALVELAYNAELTERRTSELESTLKDVRDGR